MEVFDVSLDDKFNNVRNCASDISIHDNRYTRVVSNMESYPDELEDKVYEYDNSMHAMIYRFKFTQDFMDRLYIFSKIHQYDERKDFKDAWKSWIEENEEDVNSEMRRIINLGYDGDVMDKMFKSARYYFRKKASEKKSPKERRKYVSVCHDLLEAMDKHILTNMSNEDYQPKSGFILFCHENEEILKSSINKMFQQGFNEASLIQDKIKKTYKNRYFMVTKK